MLKHFDRKDHSQSFPLSGGVIFLGSIELAASIIDWKVYGPFPWLCQDTSHRIYQRIHMNMEDFGIVEALQYQGLFQPLE